MQNSTDVAVPVPWLQGVLPQAYADCSPALWPLVEAAHDTPGRHYHGWSHVLACLAQFRGLRFERPRVVLLALLFHDAVYVPGRSDNEARSAELALQWLDEHARLPADELGRIQALILATANHHAPRDLDHDARLFLDIDLAVLGQAWPIYLRYAQQVREEWCPAVVNPEAYVRGRQQFLRGLLNQSRLYASPELARQLEAQARSNLSRELHSLTPVTPSPCVRLCTLNDQDECLGCGRTLADICGWSAMSEPERQQCLLRSRQTLVRLGRLPSSEG